MLLRLSKTLQASEQERPDVLEARALWTTRRKRFFAKALPRLVFIDETSTNTKLTKRAGWSPKGERYRTHAPFGILPLALSTGAAPARARPWASPFSAECWRQRRSACSSSRPCSR